MEQEKFEYVYITSNMNNTCAPSVNLCKPLICQKTLHFLYYDIDEEYLQFGMQSDVFYSYLKFYIFNDPLSFAAADIDQNL